MELHARPDSTPASAPHLDDLCARCGGLMVLERYMDLQDDTGQIGMTALRCTNCGEVIDPVILQNRINPVPNLLYGTKQRKCGQRVGGGEVDVTVKMDGDSHRARHAT